MTSDELIDAILDTLDDANRHCIAAEALRIELVSFANCVLKSIAEIDAGNNQAGELDGLRRAAEFHRRWEK